MDHPNVAHFRSLPKMNGDELRKLTEGFYTLLQLHAAQVEAGKPMERVLVENHRVLFAEKVKNAVEAEIVGLKGDIKHSEKMTNSVGEMLGSARQMYDKVKGVKEKLENPVGAVGDIVKDSVGNALGGLTNSLGFRVLEEEQKEGDKKEEGREVSKGINGEL